MRTALALALAALPLTACDSSQPASEPTAGTTAATEASPPTPAPAVESGPEPTAIPATLRGRWGMTAADCEPGRADAKGLLTITGDKLEFYESVGTLDEIDEGSENLIRASFDFTGEGMTWERGMELSAQDGGQTLVRREYGTDAATDPFRYTKCP